MTGEPIQPTPIATEPSFAQQIAYATPLEQKRPGLVTAIGVLSIVLGSLGILYNGVSSLQYVMYLFASRVTANLAVATPMPGPSVIMVNGQPTTVPAVAPINPATFVAALDAQTGNKFTPAVTAKLTTMLGTPGQTHAPPGTLPAQVTATVDLNGNVSLAFPNGDFIWMDKTAAQVTNMNTGMAAGGMFNISTPVATAAIITAVASTLLSIYLLVIGIITIRLSPAGRRLHWIFVYTKVPLAVASAIASYLVYDGMFSSIANNAGGVAAMSTGFAIMCAVTLILAVAYPLGLMFALRARSVKAFYDMPPAA